MASIHEEFVVDASVDRVWSALRDIGAADRVFGAMLTDSHLSGDQARVVTFASGAAVRELIIDVNDDQRRLAYTAVEGPLGSTHHQSVLCVRPTDTGKARVVWTTDVLPNELAAPIRALMRQGAQAMQHTLGTMALERPHGP